MTKRQTREVRLLTEAFNEMSQRLDARISLQRNFVADVSHELRTPLTALRGQIDVLLMNPELDDDMRQDVQHIRAELIRLSRLVSNLLMTARAEAGVLPAVSASHDQPVELDLLLVEVARQARFLNPQVSIELGHLQQVHMLGDADLLKQMLLNIVDNALTYTPAGGKVGLEVIATHDIPASLQDKQQNTQSEWARMSVYDTGPGIAPEDISLIFERYYRGAGKQARSKLGAGLGLSLARLIAQAHGGDITVESEMTKGACFHIWLPLSALSA